MKLIMTLLVRNEEDILKENIDFHLKQGVDFIIATDNRSTDSTKEILKKYESRGQLLYLYEDKDTHNQGQWVTKMARIASQKHKADWIINNDADEFWWPSKHNSLKEAFASIPQNYNIIEADRKNFILLDKHTNTHQKFYQQMIYKEYKSLNTVGKPLPPKQAHRADNNIIVSEGNHSVSGIDVQHIKYNTIEIFHFPVRTKKQFTNKILNGGGALKKNTKLSECIGITWRKLHKELLEEGNLDNYFKSNSFNAARLEKHLNNKSLLIDMRLKDYLNKIYQNN